MKKNHGLESKRERLKKEKRRRKKGEKNPESTIPLGIVKLISLSARKASSGEDRGSKKRKALYKEEDQNGVVSV